MKIEEWSTEKLREIVTGEDRHPSLPSKRVALAELEWRATQVLLSPELTLFVSMLRGNKAKLRKGRQQTVDTGVPGATAWSIVDRPCIDVLYFDTWLPLKFPDGTITFKTVEERDRIFELLPKTSWMKS